MRPWKRQHIPVCVDTLETHIDLNEGKLEPAAAREQQRNRSQTPS